MAINCRTLASIAGTEPVKEEAGSGDALAPVDCDTLMLALLVLGGIPIIQHEQLYSPPYWGSFGGGYTLLRAGFVLTRLSAEGQLTG